MDKLFLKQFLRSHGLRPNATYGQNFLVDDSVLESMVSAAALQPSDRVVEIGPGVGTLTEALCRRAGFVLAVEKDVQFLPVLKSIQKKYPHSFRYEIADALTCDYQRLLQQRRADGGAAGVPDVQPDGVPYKVVANIPYYITGKILQLFLTAPYKPVSITVLTQKEVAQNVVAQAGNLSLLALSVQLYGQPRLVQAVPAKSFYPVPKVESAVLHVTLFQKPACEVGDEKKFFGLLRSCFAGKRKQIHNTLTHNAGLSPEDTATVLAASRISGSARPQELSLSDWASLSREVQKIKTKK